MSSSEREPGLSRRSSMPRSGGAFERLNTMVFGTILNKIVLPFLILTLVVAAGGTIIVAVLASTNVEERFGAALVDATRAASESLADQEQNHLDDLQLLVFAGGIPEAIAESDNELLAERLAIVAASQGMERVIVFDENNLVMVDIERDGGSYELGSLNGVRVSGLSPIDRVLAGEIDERGDKHSGLVQIDGLSYLVTCAPVYDENRRLVGAIALATPLRSIFNQIKLEVLAEVTAFDVEGNVIETTLGALRQEGTVLPETDLLRSVYFNPAGNVELSELTVAETEELFESTSITVQDRGEFRTVLAPFYVRGQTVAVLAISQPPTVVNNVVRTNRTGLTLVFTLLALLVVVTGYAIAQNLSQPIRRLTETAEAVQAGDLTRESGVRTRDEIGVLGATFDEMTRRLNAQTRSLEASNLAQQREAAFLSAILSSAGDGIVVISLDREVLRINPVARQLIDNDLDAWITVLSALVNQVISEGVGLARLESQGLHYEALANPVYLNKNDETAVGIVVAIRNVTDQVLTDRMRNSFIAQISHELRTPLTVIKGFTDLTAHMLEPQQQTLKGFMRSVQENTETLNTMLNRILDVSLMVKGSLEIERETVRLADLLDSVMLRYADLTTNKKLRVTVDCPRELLINVDVSKFAWALEEVIKNAMQYTEPGDEVSIEARVEDTEVSIRVRDNGVGIAPSELPRVFEQFYRGFPTRSDGSLIETRGAGLGLFVLRNVVEAHGGSVSAQSNVETGSEFLIRLPVEAAES